MSDLQVGMLMCAVVAVFVVLLAWLIRRKAGGGKMEAVVVPDSVGAHLFRHLAEQGRATKIESEHDAQSRLTYHVSRAWETPKAQKFDDKVGIGWLFDISDVVDGEALYAVARSFSGQRVVVAVVDEDEVFEFRESHEWKTEALKSNNPPDIDLETLKLVSQAEGKAPPAPAPRRIQAGQPAPTPSSALVAQTDPSDPMLIVITKNGSDDVVTTFRFTREEVPGAVKMLLHSGHDGSAVEESQIEIWSKVSKPRVEVQF